MIDRARLATLTEREAAVFAERNPKSAAAYAGCTVNALHKAMSSRDVDFSQETPHGKAWFKREWIDSWRMR